MAQGNFTVRSQNPEYYIGDYENIIQSMRNLRDTMEGTIAKINRTARLVDSESGQVAAGAQALSQGSAEQASSTEELTATVTEINRNIEQAGTAANEASIKATEAGRLTGECNEQMKQLVLAMHDISATSSQIEKIIKEIDDIAFQTNILALNAAVEAARAGAAGKGFAVVADEVRSLAAKSAEAAQNTAQLIECSIVAVNRGERMVESTAKGLQVVAENADTLADMINDIAATAQKTTHAINQVTIGLEQVSAVVHNNSATAEESAATSEELSNQAAMLKSLVAGFQLRDQY